MNRRPRRSVGHDGKGDNPKLQEQVPKLVKTEQVGKDALEMDGKEESSSQEISIVFDSRDSPKPETRTRSASKRKSAVLARSQMTRQLEDEAAQNDSTNEEKQKVKQKRKSLSARRRMSQERPEEHKTNTPRKSDGGWFQPTEKTLTKTFPMNDPKEVAGPSNVKEEPLEVPQEVEPERLDAPAPEVQNVNVGEPDFNEPERLNADQADGAGENELVANNVAEPRPVEKDEEEVLEADGAGDNEQDEEDGEPMQIVNAAQAAGDADELPLNEAPPVFQEEEEQEAGAKQPVKKVVFRSGEDSFVDAKESPDSSDEEYEEEVPAKKKKLGLFKRTKLAIRGKLQCGIQ